MMPEIKDAPIIEEVCASLIQQIKEVQGIISDAITSMRMDTQLGVIRLLAEMAKRVIEAEKIQTEWIVYRTIKNMQLTTCLNVGNKDICYKAIIVRLIGSTSALNAREKADKYSSDPHCSFGQF